MQEVSRSHDGDSVLVLGSYPPSPGPASAMTMAVVRQARSKGQKTTVISYRPSAATLSVPVVGLLSGRRLAQARSYLGLSGQLPRSLVVVIEPEAPFPSSPKGVIGFGHELFSVMSLLPAMSRFGEVTLAVVGKSALCPQSVKLLEKVVGSVLLGSKQDEDFWIQRYGTRLRTEVIDAEQFLPDGYPGGVRGPASQIGIGRPLEGQDVPWRERLTEQAMARAVRLGKKLIPQSLRPLVRSTYQKLKA